MKIALDLSEKDIKAIEFLALNLGDAAHMVLDECYSKEEHKQWDDCITFIDNLDEIIRRAEDI